MSKIVEYHDRYNNTPVAVPVRYMVVKRWYGAAIWDTKAHDGWWTIKRFVFPFCPYPLETAHYYCREWNVAEGYAYAF